MPISHVTASHLQDWEIYGTDPSAPVPPPLRTARARSARLAKFSPSVSGTAVRNRAHNGINAGARATRETPAVNGQ